MTEAATAGRPETPDFNDARGFGTLQLKPPFRFKGVTMAVFPLRADLARLRAFSSSFLNHTEIVRFEPVVPYVYLMLLDYGQMSIEAANLGWFSQREVAFAVPLRWRMSGDGGWPTQDWAFNSPFIFVDSEMSMTTGREVYGWPKTLVHLDSEISDWVRDPHGVRRVFSVSQRYRHATPRPFLTLHRERPPRLLDAPPDLSRALRPLTRVPDAAAQMAGLGFDLLQAASGIAVEGITQTAHFPDLLDPRVLVDLLGPKGVARWLDPRAWSRGAGAIGWGLLPRNYWNTVNLKQFRDAASPWNACYQALTNARMVLESVQRGGPLGQANLMLGQLHGGYRIDVYRYASLPVIDALGLEIAESRLDGGVPVASLRPVVPFWLELDMRYGRAKTLAWRSRSSGWRPGDRFDEPPEGSASGRRTEGRAAAVSRGGAGASAVAGEEVLYCTARGPGEQTSGPFRLPDTTVRVLPLVADQEKLNEFVAGYLNVDGHARFEAWGRHVYLVALNYGGATSEARNVGLFASCEMRFAVPVRWYDWDKKELVTVALTCPFSYADDVMVSITASEVSGVPTMFSEVARPPDPWMETRGPAEEAPKGLLDTSTLVLPTLGVGAGASHKTFLAVREADCLTGDDESGWRHVGRQWGPLLLEDLREKYRQRGVRQEQWSESGSFRRVRAMALELIAGRQPLHTVTLKQFRDAWRPGKACYQSLVLGSTRIERLHELHEIERPLHVSITRYPTQPVVEILGLQAKHSQVVAEGIVDILEPLRPFWFRADLREDLGHSVFERVGTADWEDRGGKPDRGERRLLTYSGALNHIDRVHVPDLAAFREAQEGEKKPKADGGRPGGQRRGKGGAGVIESCRWRTTLAPDLGRIWPATVLDSVLSRQWARPLHARRRFHKADFCLPTGTLGPGAGEAIFPPSERQEGFWPPSGDYSEELRLQRKALALLVWDEVWRLVRNGRLREGSMAEREAEREGRQLVTREQYSQMARDALPDWFQELAVPPDEWTAAHWQDIAAGLGQLVHDSHYRADWNRVIRPLDDFRRKAQRVAEGFPETLDSALRPGQTVDHLEKRLKKLTG